MTIMHFVGRAGLSAKAKEKEFIELCKFKLTLWGADLDWPSLNWKATGISFTNLDQVSRVADPKNALHPGINDFAKAYIRYQQSHRRTRHIKEIIAIKCIERALTERRSIVDVQHITVDILNEAAGIARARYSLGVAYNAGQNLEKLANFISDRGLGERRLEWKNPIPRARSSVRTGKEAQAARDAKLPDADALNAIATIFSQKPTADRDVFTTSVAAMLLCAPSRCTAVLSLTEDCEVRETKSDGTKAYGWRFPRGKNYPSETKWIPDECVPLAVEAIARVRRITEEGRRIAKWLEDRPNEFYRHLRCPDVKEDEPLTEAQVVSAIGLTELHPNMARSELKRLGVPAGDGNNTLRSLNSWVRSKLPRDFPYLSLESESSESVKFSEALFCFQAKQLKAGAQTRPYMVCWHRMNWVNWDLQPRVGRRSLFQRHLTLGINPNAKITSHQFRHYLNTLAMRGGLSEEELAKWSGRKDRRQNAAYDQRSERELVQQLRSSDPSLNSPSAQEIAQRLSETRSIKLKDLDPAQHRAVHVGEYGFCDHDFVFSPCQRFRDCINCSEQICIKGDPRNQRMKVRLEKIDLLLARAQEGEQNGDIGADRWVDTQMRERARLRGFIEIFEDPRVPDGTLIRLRSDVEYSRVQEILSRDYFILSSNSSMNAQLQLPSP